ncbi:MAG: hypothetical protein JO190_00465 [Candidatus Eremiobacteraeota bacterium]|nr:hypothetical protein [Candidatus Eremiobacteraeota bacterium]MBV8499888.1 hypothetical protein [Candidatus Eremiobacteraeota bacterium]
MTYEAESRALDREILAVIERWHRYGESPHDSAFGDLALRVFDYQLRYNAPYARYCARLGVTPACPPSSWEAIPAVPAPAFKEAALTTFDPGSAALTFETSGTSGPARGRHHMETPALYDAALLAAFDRLVLPDDARLRYFNLVPNPQERPASSLGYMMARISERRGKGRTGWYLNGDELLYDEFASDLCSTIEDGCAVFIAATAFALMHALDALERDGTRLALPRGSRIMQTGGFKGRSRVVDRAELYERTCGVFGVAHAAIVSEYGMTELTSQYYQDAVSGNEVGPPWLRARVVGPDRRAVAPGSVGSLLHVDLANRSSCVAVQTEDLGIERAVGFTLLGREAEALPRGCSLDAETLQTLFTPRC